jgi:hypothetical protein
MRTSIKILIAALALVIAGLITYDTQLKAEYLTGNFKKPFGNFVPANFSNFNAIELRSATAINLLVVKGPYKVLVEPTASDFVRIEQQGSKLILQADFKNHYRSYSGDYNVFISCPDLTSFTSDARYKVDNWPVTDTLPNIFGKKPTQINGFNLASLTLTEDNGSNVILQNDHIASLKAAIATGYDAASIITIGTGNAFTNADIQVLNKGTLNIDAPAGNNISYHIADSARLSVNGATSKQLFKNTQP